MTSRRLGLARISVKKLLPRDGVKDWSPSAKTRETTSCQELGVAVCRNCTSPLLWQQHRAHVQGGECWEWFAEMSAGVKEDKTAC